MMVSINRIKQYIDPPDAKNQLQECIGIYVSTRLAFCLEQIGEEVIHFSRQWDMPLKDIKIMIEDLTIQYLPAEDPMKNRRRNS